MVAAIGFLSVSALALSGCAQSQRDSGGGGKEGRAGLDRLLDSRGVNIVTFRDWQKIEAAEAARARDGHPREKFVAVEEMLRALDR